MNYKPEDDGKTHINVYSKGLTELGQFLSNFADAPAQTPDGEFASIEGYWYWLSCRDDRLRKLSGWLAKSVGRRSKGKDWLKSTDFKERIKTAIRMKLEAYPDMYAELKACKLPLTHYYVYGPKVTNVPKAKWIIDYIETLKGDTVEKKEWRRWSAQVKLSGRLETGTNMFMGLECVELVEIGALEEAKAEATAYRKVLEQINREELNAQRPGGSYSRAATLSYEILKKYESK